MDEKTRPVLSKRNQLQTYSHIQTEKEGMEKDIFHANGNEKKAGIALLTVDKIDFKIKTVARNKEGHYIMKGSISQRGITIINVYSTNTGAPQCIRPMLIVIKGELTVTEIAGNLSPSLHQWTDHPDTK